MKSICKIVLYCVFFLAVLTVGISCSHSSSDGDGGGGAPDPAGVVLLAEWSASVTDTRNGQDYFEEYYYYLYSNNYFVYRIVSYIDPNAATQELYGGRWELYAGNQNHTYHFEYDLTTTQTAHTWGDLDITGTIMNVYYTENRTAIASDGLTIISTQFPAPNESFSR